MPVRLLLVVASMSGPPRPDSGDGLGCLLAVFFVAVALMALALCEG
jgi:hypothetical protein